MNAKPDTMVCRKSGRNDYRVANLEAMAGSSKYDTRAEFIKLVTELAGEEAGESLANKLAAADMLVRPDGTELSIELLAEEIINQGQ